MNLKIKDVVIIAIISLVSLPVMYFAMLFLTGNAKIVYVAKEADMLSGGKNKKMKYQKHSRRRDSLMVMHSQSFLASQRERSDVEEEMERLAKQKEHLAILQQELERTRQKLAEERKRFEKLVEQNDELEMKRIKQLAKVYGAMRANEAAQILETLDDRLLIKIIKAIGDDRQKAKIMASLSKSKASRISKRMGKSVK